WRLLLHHPQVITGGNGMQDCALLCIQVLTRHLWWQFEFLPVKCHVQQVVGDLTCNDAMQGGKKVHQLSNDEATVLRGCEPTEEVKRIDWYGTHSPSRG